MDNYINVKVFALTPRQAQISLIGFSTYKRSQSVLPGKDLEVKSCMAVHPTLVAWLTSHFSFFPSTLRSRKFSWGYKHLLLLMLQY